MKKLVLAGLFLTLTALTSFASAQSVSQDEGTSWLRVPESTRDSGAGGAFGADPDAMDAVDINPSELGLSRGSEISFSQNFWAQGLSMQHLVFSQGLPGGNGFAFGADYLNFGTITNYSVVGGVLTANGSYSPFGLNLYGGYGFNLGEGWRAGLTAHFIYDNIQQNFADQTAAADAGLYYAFAGLPLSLSAVVSDIGWNLDTGSLPLALKTAAAYEWDLSGQRSLGLTSTSLLTLGAEGDWSLIDFNSTIFGLGAEYWYHNLAALRVGYRFENSTNLTGVRGLSLGAGIRYMDWQLDYAMTTIGDFGTSNQIALSLHFGDDENTPVKVKPVRTPVAMKLHQDILPIPLTLESSKGIRQWSVEVDNSAGRLIWGREGQGTPPSDLSWDGKDKQGRFVPEGSYLVKATLTDLDGVVERLTLIVVEARFPAVTLPGWKNTYIAQNIDFKSGKDDFTEAEGETVLAAVQAILKVHPDFLIYVEGHTDSVLSKRGISNEQLSDERAGAIKDYLVKKGINPGQLDAKGFGDTEPMASNDDEEGRAQNRRVELLLFQK